MSDVAIVGMSVRLPGAGSLEEYWNLIKAAREEINRHSRQEMLDGGAAAHLVDDPNWVNASAPLANAESFDAEFFGYSVRESETMDPQHRIFLECAYNAFEDAFIDPSLYWGEIGVYAGTTMNTYVPYNLMANGEVYNVIGDLQTMIGNDKDYLATRVSYKLGLTGPSMSVQTACSSSLVAVHVAVRALLDGECDVALAGGSSLRMPHAAGYMANPGGTSSPDGHCRAFDKDSKGSVPGSGAGAVVLKRLEDAVRDGDRVWAVIAGSAVSNDGQHKASFSAPSVDGQARAASKALARAGVSGSDIAYVEAHGTGTLLGDPIEVAGLVRAYDRAGSGSTCWLGSVKPNIGHLDAGAGIAGLIKAALVVHHRTVPPVANFKEINPHLNIEGSGFDVPAQVTELQSDGDIFVAVNSVGMGGTNAHVILRSAPSNRLYIDDTQASADGGSSLFLSAKSEKALAANSVELSRWLLGHPDIPLEEVAQALHTRPQHKIRQVVHASNLTDAVRTLKRRTGRNFDVAKVSPGRDLVWLLPGQGSGAAGVLGEWVRQYPEVSARLERVTKLFADNGVHVLDYLIEEERSLSSLSSLDSQASIFAAQWAVGDALLAEGVRPVALLGHSLGEWTAAALAGVLTLDDAVLCIVERGRQMDASPKGAMLWAAMKIARARELATNGITLAAENAPELVTFSGSVGAIEDLVETLTSAEVPHGRLSVEHAFHSPDMAEAAAHIAALMETMQLSSPKIPIISGRTGERLDAATATSPEYWAAQTLGAVRFAEGVGSAFQSNGTGFLEFSAREVLAPLVAACGTTAENLNDGPLFSTPTETSLREFAAGLWLRGVDLIQRATVSFVGMPAMPPYAFDRTRYWLEPISPFDQNRRRGSDHVGVTPDAPRAGVGEVEQQRAPIQETNGAQGQPELAAGGPGGSQTTDVRAETTAAWCELLGVNELRESDNFFELGGHSLLATQLVVRLRKTLGVEIPMVTVFDAPTYGEFLNSVRALTTGSLEVEHDTTVVELSSELLGRGEASDSFERAVGESVNDYEARIARLVDAMSNEEAEALLAELKEERPGS